MKIFTLIILMISIVSCTPKTSLVAKDTMTPLSSPTPTPEKMETTSTPVLDNTNPASTDMPTRTPSLTITPYPTFEINDIKTQVPFQPAQCPPENPNYKTTVHISRDTNLSELAEIVQHELDEGAPFSQVEKDIEKALQIPNPLKMSDLTGDGVPEVIVHQLFNTVVMGCVEGKYSFILDFSAISDPGLGLSPSIIAVQDMNLNGIPDVVWTYTVTTGCNTFVDILEWDGIQFISLIQANHGANSSVTSTLAKTLYWYSSIFHNWSDSDVINTPVMEGRADIDIRTGVNGTQDLILTDKGPAHWDTLFNYGPWRGKQVIFKWDGIHYLYSSLEIDPPVFRFQAVQDADRQFLLGEYDEALRLYQDVISNEQLEWWSPEKMQYIEDSYFADLDGNPTPVPPQSNTDEYLSLAAYARFRILLLHLSRGWISDANTAYTTLIEAFPEGTTGSQFADMATIFWNEYQKTNSLEQSCLPVMDYVESHPEILAPLGNFQHGFQSHIYVAEDVCPFQ